MIKPNKYVVDGVKKLFSLAKTKIRLARESDTIETKPRPLPLVKRFHNQSVSTITEAMEFTKGLKASMDYGNPMRVAETTLALMDVVEGVKHEFEPSKLCVLAGQKEIQQVKKAVDEGEKINILVMDGRPRKGLNIYVGYDPPINSIHYGRPPTTLAHYLTQAFNSQTLSHKNILRETRVFRGRETLINTAIAYGIQFHCSDENKK